MKRWLLAAALGATLIASPVWARKGGAAKADKDDDDSEDESDTKKKPDPKKDAKKADAKAKKADAAKKKSGDDDDDDSDSDDKKKTEPKKGDAKADAIKKSGDDDDDSGDDDDDSSGGFKGSTKNVTKDTGETPMVKQDLNGHDMGARKRTTAFEKDRFFVDKSDTAKTEKGTLIQGSLTSSSFAYHESGGALSANTLAGNEASGDSRMFTDLRLQTDFRHISGGRWDARIDGRIRFVNSGTTDTETMATGAPAAHIQSGLLGKNEYDLRELWLIRNGERTDVTIGRQYVLDLAAVKIDGLRVDYASSPQLTYLGFAGLYPFRGSRSLTTDYVDLKNPTDGTPAGQFIGTGGFGAAYRTSTAYGAFGGVTQVPLQAEQPRVFGTANGYWRVNPKLDIYHYALIDLVSSYGAQLTNLTGGVNYKPTQRLRMTASYNRVDTETLNIQAGAYLDSPNQNSVVQNETFVSRLATTEARGSVSAGLGNLERVEVTVAAAYRSRPSFTLIPFVPTGSPAVPPINLSAARGYEVYGSVIDRHSFADARIGVDAVQTFSSGTVAFQRDELFALRAFVSRELQSGKGEWEAEISYATTKDTNSGYTCATAADLATCYGQTNGTVLSAGGALYYRLNRDWFLIGQAYLSQTTLKQANAMSDDSSILGLSGYVRIAYRF